MRAFVASLVLLTVGVSAAHANLIVNGSFENPALAPGTYGIYSSILGWTATPPTQIEVGRFELYGVSGASGLNVLELDSVGNSIVSQTVNLSAAGGLNLSFDFARRNGTATSTNLLSVYLNGSLVAAISPTSTAMTTASYYGLTGLAGANTLTFVATGTSDSLGGIIDNVTMSTPAPGAAVSMLCTGLVALRRRKRSA